MPDNPILITHTDFDGVTCAILFKAVWPEGLVYYEDYKTVDQRIVDTLISDASTIYITDISPSSKHAEEIAAEIQANVEIHRKIHLFDHHETAKWLNQYGWAHVNSHWCGAKIFHHYLTEHGKTVGRYNDLVYCADTYDCWQNNNPDFRHASMVNRLLYILDRERFVKRFIENPFVRLSDSEYLLLILDAEHQSKYIQETIDNAYLLESRHGAQYALCFAEEYPSQIGHALLEKFPELNYAAIVNLKAGTVGLRSRQNSYDVSGLASEYGGGGHQAAAGFQLGKEHIMALDGQIFHKHTKFDCDNCCSSMDSVESESEKVRP
jgi:oligoribonuclease NrnB/cAMP/cGMP phosphodiesterase (DHH superfamily)